MPLPADPTFGCGYAPNQLPPALPVPPPSRVLVPKPPLPTPPPTVPPGASPEQLAYPYLQYWIDTVYEWFEGTIQLPIAQPPAPLPPLGKPLLPSPPVSPTPPVPVGGTVSIPGGASVPPLSGFGPVQAPTQTRILAPQYGQVAPQAVSGGGSTAPSDSATARPACVIVQTCAPYGRKTVRFHIIRVGAQPELPDPTPQSVNETLKNCETKIAGPQATPDGKDFIWTASGTYVYHLTRPYWASDGLVGGSSPADNTRLDTNYYPSTQYASGVA